jgi:sugar lactone lactonase YvrE
MTSVCITGDLHCELGEGPIYDDRLDRLYFVDINKSTVYAIDAVSNAVSNAVTGSPSSSGQHHLDHVVRTAFVCPENEPASCAFLTSDPSKLLVGTCRRLRLVDLELQSSSVIATLPDCIGATDAGARFNDGKVTPDGTHLVVGHLSLSWRTGPMGSLSAFDAKTLVFRDITPAPLGIGCPNGIVWRNGEFIIVDSRDESVRAYGTDEHGVPDTSQHRLIHQTKTNHANVPDGMALDDCGNLWVAVGESGLVRCVNGSTGEVVREVEVGYSRPTSCNFGGKGLDVLFVTSRVDKAGDGGGLFAVTGLGVRGAGYDGKFSFLQ